MSSYKTAFMIVGIITDVWDICVFFISAVSILHIHITNTTFLQISNASDRNDKVFVSLIT